MKYVSWAVFYEGASDGMYMDVLLPRVIRHLIAREGNDVVEIPDVPAVKLGLRGRSIKELAEEACECRDAFDVIFIHADTGGRSLEKKVSARSSAYCEELAIQCEWPSNQCITITPRHETEAWLLADPDAVINALGYRGTAASVGLPTDASAAERLVDPKQVLTSAIEQIAGRRRAKAIESIFASVAQRQDIDLLRRSLSFLQFEQRLRVCLQTLHCLPSTVF